MPEGQGCWKGRDAKAGCHKPTSRRRSLRFLRTLAHRDLAQGAISDSAKRGFVLYNNKALCFACHGGWRSTDDKFHDIGTSTSDLGRGREIKTDPQMQYAFKTPTLRSVALRAPYMQNGSSVNLDEVMRHYEKGGLDRPSRSPLMMPVQLSEQERRDLVAFMETLTGAPEGDTAPKLPGLP